MCMDAGVLAHSSSVLVIWSNVLFDYYLHSRSYMSALVILNLLSVLRKGDK